MRRILILITFLFGSCAWYSSNYVKDYKDLKTKPDIDISGHWSEHGFDNLISFTIYQDTLLNKEAYNVSNLYVGDILAFNQPYKGFGFYNDSLLTIKFKKIVPIASDNEIVTVDTLFEQIHFISLDADGEVCLLEDHIYKNLFTDYEYPIKDSTDIKIKIFYSEMKKSMKKDGVPVLLKIKETQQ